MRVVRLSVRAVCPLVTCLAEQSGERCACHHDVPGAGVGATPPLDPDGADVGARVGLLDGGLIESAGEVELLAVLRLDDDAR